MGKKEESKKITSDRIHNKNCFAYLKKLRISPFVSQEFSNSLLQKIEMVQRQVEYDETFPYADVYTSFFLEVEENIERIYDKRRSEISLTIARAENYAAIEDNLNPETADFMKMYGRSLGDINLKKTQIRELDDFIFSIYDNDNSILPQTFEAIKNIPLTHTPSDEKIESSISKLLADEGKNINQEAHSPAQAGSLVGRLNATLTNDFKPQHNTSLATIRSYEYHKDSQSNPTGLVEYRFGTQGQRHDGVERASPLFERWLEVSAIKGNSNAITHIYFNNLGLDRTDIEGKKEKKLTDSLHELEARHPNLAVITLPADKGFMGSHEYAETSDTHQYSEVYDEFFKIAHQDKEASAKTKDFYISDSIRRLIFKGSQGLYSQEAEKEQLNALLAKSFAVMGFNPGSTLSSAERQAVWFHFIKYELTNHIIQQLGPKSINFSCKDAIDRGGVASAYYNLMKSFATERPMSREEFECGLHAAPAMVKGRGMNHHLNLIWNAVDGYVNNHYLDLKNDKERAWLIEWRDLNCPHIRVSDLLDLRIKQSILELTTKQHEHPDNFAIAKGLKVLKEIEAQKALGVSGKRLLLEAVVGTTKLALGPRDEETIHRYTQLIDKLNIFSAKLHMLAGLMKMLVGIVVYGASLGHAASILHSGWATYKTGHEHQGREDIRSHMKDMKAGLQSLKPKIEDEPDESDSRTEQIH